MVAHAPSLIPLLILLFIAYSNQQSVTWTNVASVPNLDTDETAFSVNAKGYIITTNNQTWEYDPAPGAPLGIWRRVADIPFWDPAGPLANMISFSIGNKGYVGTGSVEGPGVCLTAMYVFDPVINVWSRIRDHPVCRDGAIAFCIAGKAYVGTGLVNSSNIPTNDMWEYDPKRDSWRRVADYPLPTEDAVALAVDGKGYVGTGNRETATPGVLIPHDQWWEYDPFMDRWTRKADFPAPTRDDAVGFSLGSKGYVGTGLSGGTGLGGGVLKDIFEYDPNDNSWTRIPDLPGLARQDAVAFVLGCDGYLAGGNNSPAGRQSGLLADVWRITIPNCVISPCQMPPPSISPPPACIAGQWVLNDNVFVTTVLDLQNTSILIVGNLSLNGGGVLKVDGGSVIEVGGCLEFDGVLEINVSTLNTSQPFVPLDFRCIVNSSIRILVTGQKECEEISVDGDFVKPTSIVLVFDIRDGCPVGEDEDKGGGGGKLGTGVLAGIAVGGVVVLSSVVVLAVIMYRRVHARIARASFNLGDE